MSEQNYLERMADFNSRINKELFGVILSSMFVCLFVHAPSQLQTECNDFNLFAFNLKLILSVKVTRYYKPVQLNSFQANNATKLTVTN